MGLSEDETLSIFQMMRNRLEPVKRGISPEVQYACKYWVTHVVQSSPVLEGVGLVHLFLQTHLLNWLQVMGILSRASKPTIQLKMLRDMPEVTCVITPSLEFLAYFLRRHVAQSSIPFKMMCCTLYIYFEIFSMLGHHNCIVHSFYSHTTRALYVAYSRTLPRIG